ncbi:hypothetical protein [Thiohalomonas denitrificans]|uniref:hypothetical protein n=1 Tax=Thiohalomonas denitrificans TaxID=415747 RepID=UPI0026EFC110|nr:hypothetical protein [Thiohalomonas denitrificans]
MNSNTIAYVGMWTGIIGALTGVAGSIMGFVAYRHSREVREADRRLELDKLRNAAHVAAVSLVDLLPRALQSRKAVLNARGMLHSGLMQRFQEQYERDLKRATELAGMVPNTQAAFGSLSVSALEKQIIELDRTKGWIDELLNTYQTAVAEDEKMREEICANAHAKK